VSKKGSHLVCFDTIKKGNKPMTEQQQKLAYAVLGGLITALGIYTGLIDLSFIGGLLGSN
jgi:hypothetical protein